MGKLLIIAGALWLGVLPSGVVAQTKKKAPVAPRKATKAQQADRRLSLDQIRKLISIHTPDDVVAGEIQSRGISGDYSRRDISQIRQQGGGPRTAAAMTRLLPVATLTVRTEPGAAVRLDSNPPVFAGADGVAAVADVDPGPHTVTVAKQYFTSFSRVLELKGRENSAIDAKLDWAVGFLSVGTNAADAQIQIAGNPPQTGRIVRMAVPIGQVAVSAAAPLRKPVSQTVAIEPGKEASVTLSLPVDEAALSGMANQIHVSFRSRQYQAVLQQSNRYFQTGARDKTVLADVALSELELNRFEDFKNVARQAMAAGATLEFRVQHHHAGWNSSMHPATIAVTDQTLRFQPEGKCNVDPFEIPLSQVHVGNRTQASVAIERSLVSKERTIWVVDLVVPNPSNPKKTVNLNFTTEPEDLRRVEAMRAFFQTLTQ